MEQDLGVKVTWDDEGAQDGLDNLGQSASSVWDIVSGIIISDILVNLYDQIVNIGQAAIDSSAGLENIAIAADYAFGSDSAASKMLDTLNNISTTTPFTNQQLDTLAIRMENMGVPTKQITGDLEDLADVASATGTNLSDMGGILQTTGNVLALAYQRGSIASLQLRSIANQGIPIYQALAAVTGKPLQDFLTTSKTFQITAQQLQSAFQYISENKDLGAAQAQADSYNGILQKLGQQYSETIDAILGVSQSGTIAKGGVFDELSEAAKTFLAYLNQNRVSIVAFGQELIQIFQQGIAPAVQQAFAYITTHKDEIVAFIKGLIIDFSAFVAVMVSQGIPAIVTFVSWVIDNRNQILGFFNDLYYIVEEVVAAIQLIVQGLNDVANLGKSEVGLFNSLTGGNNKGLQGAFANGVTNFGGGLALVGENGPEIVNLPQGSSVTPNNQIGQTVNIVNPTVRSDSDIQMIIKQVKQALGRQNELSKLGAIGT